MSQFPCRFCTTTQYIIIKRSHFLCSICYFRSPLFHFSKGEKFNYFVRTFVATTISILWKLYSILNDFIYVVSYAYTLPFNGNFQFKWVWSGNWNVYCVLITFLFNLCLVSFWYGVWIRERMMKGRLFEMGICLIVGEYCVMYLFNQH